MSSEGSKYCPLSLWIRKFHISLLSYFSVEPSGLYCQQLKMATNKNCLQPRIFRPLGLPITRPELIEDFLIRTGKFWSVDLQHQCTVLNWFYSFSLGSSQNPLQSHLYYSNILQHKFELKSKKMFKSEIINAISRQDSHTVPLEVKSTWNSRPEYTVIS